MFKTSIRNSPAIYNSQSKGDFRLRFWNVRTLNTDLCQLYLQQNMINHPIDCFAIAEHRLLIDNLETKSFECEFGPGHYIIVNNAHQASGQGCMGGVASVVNKSFLKSWKENGRPRALYSNRIFRITVANNNRPLHLICCYAPWSSSNPGETNSFCTNLLQAINSVPQRKDICLLGNFNAQIQKDTKSLPNIINRFLTETHT